MKNLNTTDNARFKRMIMFILSLSPVLFSYVTSFNMNYGEVSFFLLFLLIIVTNSVRNYWNVPKGYYIFWVICACCLLINEKTIKLSFFIPGGIAFFIFSVSLMLSCSCISTDSLYKYFKIIFLISVVIFVFQILGFLPVQYRNSFVLPISDHIGYSNMDIETLIQLRDNSSRPSSIFLEPSYYAQFVTICLAVELFYKVDRTKLYSKRSLFIALVLVLIRSGLGMIGLLVVLSFKIICFSKAAKQNFKYLFFIIPIVVLCGLLYLSSEMGTQMSGRIEELSVENSSGYVRILQGYFFFDNLPVIHKFIGISQEGLVEYNNHIITYDTSGEMSLFTNGFFNLLIRNGLLGLLALLYVCIAMYKTTNELGKCCLILLLMFSLVEQVYLAPSMLICLTFASVKTDK